MKSELARVRRQGFAVNNEEVEPGVRCIGAPIFDHNSRVIATLSIAGPVFRMTKDRVPELARIVVNVANALSSELGHPDVASWERSGRCPACWDALKIRGRRLHVLVAPRRPVDDRQSDRPIAHSRLDCPVAANARVGSSHAGEHQRRRHGHVQCCTSRCHRRGHWTGIAKAGRGRQQRRRRVQIESFASRHLHDHIRASRVSVRQARRRAAGGRLHCHDRPEPQPGIGGGDDHRVRSIAVG